ncbi:MAG: class I SAM-dependent methyltransferase [Nitrospinaceae bacterium]|jgi:hypothetical protein|nr:MAG: class I SAM-dependent methyltransferase [Nitrospinaceae bacterium]
MNERPSTADESPWTLAPGRLPLLSDAGRSFPGLEHSSCPELAEALKDLLHHFDGAIGFSDSATGQSARLCFNRLLQAAYPELLLDLADRLYVQHERPAVFLNFDHININLRKYASPQPLEPLNRTMARLFDSFCEALKKNRLADDPLAVGHMARGYSHYMHQTKNFPWDDPPPDLPEGLTQPVLDVAPGLTGFSAIDLWPENHPTLVLADQMPFIVETLTHFKNLAGKKNVDVAAADFARKPELGTAFGFIQANKFMHHLKRPERQSFLDWVMIHLQPGGHFHILDTNLEQQILKESRRPGFQGKLIPGYLKTLVEMEGGFCENLARDTKAAGFEITHFDFHEYQDETDAYSEHPGDTISLKFIGLEIAARRPAVNPDS